MPRQSLADFQHAFAQALMQPAATPPAESSPIAALLRQAGFAVYRNTVLRGCVDALLANYPAVARLVGEPWFRAAAAEYVRAHWPARPMLVDYGDRFAEFLTAFAPAAELPYLPAVAQLDRCWTEAHLAADAPALRAADFARLIRQVDLQHLQLRPHPAARWRWFDAVPALTIWQRNRTPSTDTAVIDWRGEGALLTRPAGAVDCCALPRAGAALLDACAAGLPLAAALEQAAAAAAAEGINPLLPLLPLLLEAGAFVASDRLAIDSTEPPRQR